MPGCGCWKMSSSALHRAPNRGTGTVAFPAAGCPVTTGGPVRIRGYLLPAWAPLRMWKSPTDCSNMASKRTAPRKSDERQLIATIVEQRSADRPDNLHYLALARSLLHCVSRSTHAASETYNQLVSWRTNCPRTRRYWPMRRRPITSPLAVRLDGSARACGPSRRWQWTRTSALPWACWGWRSYERGQVSPLRSSTGNACWRVEPPGSESAADDSTPSSGACETDNWVTSDPAAVASRRSVATEDKSGPLALPFAGQCYPTARSCQREIPFSCWREVRGMLPVACPLPFSGLRAGQLPITVRLDDGNSMAGQKLSDFNSRNMVLVQVSPRRPAGGEPTPPGWARRPLAPSDSQPSGDRRAGVVSARLLAGVGYSGGAFS